MRSRSKLRIAPAAAIALALAACAPEARQATEPFISENAEFVEIIGDARAEIEEGNLADAGKLYDQAREIEPENPALWVDIARLRFRGGEHKPALEAADYAIELGPQYGPALLLRAQLVRDAHGLKDALPWFEAAVQADPGNAEAMADYAATLGDLGRHQDMLEVVRELEKTAGKYPPVYYLQAVLAARAEKPVLARSLLAKSGMFQRGVPAALLLDALIDMQQDSPDTAVETLEQLAARQPGNARVQELLARALWLSGRDDELIERFGERATAADATPYLTMLVGRTYERRGEREAAAPLIEQALAAQTVQRVALAPVQGLPEQTARLRNMMASGSTGGAQQAGAQLVKQYAGSSDMHGLAGDAALSAGSYSVAFDNYAEAAKVRRAWPLARKIIAAYRAYGDDRAADTMLARALAGEPRNTEAALMLAERRVQAQDWQRASVLLDYVIALGAGNDPKVLDLRAVAAQGLEREEEALQFSARAEALRPGRLVRSQ